MGKVSRNTLLFLAGLLWSIAGYKVTNIGYTAWINVSSPIWILLICAICVFSLFGGIIFRKLYHKYTKRIQSMPEKNYPWTFFDLRGWCIMTFMITLGIYIRHTSWVSPFFIAFFYIGLGSALFLTGLRFFYFYLCSLRCPK